MELNEVLELVKAGFTKDEIMQMAPHPTPVTDTVPAVEPTATPAPNPEPVPAPVAEPVAQPAQVDAPNQSTPTLEDIMKGIAHLTSAVQANAIANSVIPQGMTQPVKPEDIMAEIIRPTYKERKE